MALPVSCDECFTAFEAPTKAAGKRVRCPTCGAAVKVRRGGAAAAPVASSRPRKAQRAAPASTGPSTGVLVGAGLAALLLVGGGALAIGLALGGGGEEPAVVAANDAGTDPITDPPAPAAPTPAPTAAARTTVADAEPSGDRTGDRRGAPPALAATVPGAPAELGGLESPAAALADADTPAASKDDGKRESTPTGEKTAAREDGLARVRSERLAGEDLVTTVMPSIVRVNNVGPDGAGHGSGWVVHPDGLIVTNYHVVAGAAKIDVEFKDGTKASSPGYLLVEPKYDIAVIKIDPPAGTELVPVPVLPELPAQGQRVVAFGAPIGLDFSTTEGSVSGLRSAQELENLLNSDQDGDWVQTDAAISGGNSGGPLCDTSGNVVAMNTMTLQSTGGGGLQNLNFGISCVSILDRLQTVLGGDAEVKAWEADKLKEYDGSLERRLVENELGTNKGKRLLAGMREVLILPFGYKGDPQSAGVWRVVRNYAEKSIDRLDLNIIWEKPDRVDFTVLLVKMDLKQARRGSTTQELILTAELVMPDLENDSKRNLFCRVWQQERSCGTMSLRNIASGRPPRSMQRPITQFFGSLRRAVQNARELSDAQELDRDDDIDGGRLAESGEDGLFEELFGGLFEDDAEDSRDRSGRRR